MPIFIHTMLNNEKIWGDRLFTYDEKKYMLSLLKKERKPFEKNPDVNSRLIEKLEQMIRNEEVNSKDLRNNKL